MPKNNYFLILSLKMKKIRTMSIKKNQTIKCKQFVRNELNNLLAISSKVKQSNKDSRKSKLLLNKCRNQMRILKMKNRL